MRDLLKHAVTVLFGRGLVRIAQLLTFLLLARLLTPEEFGWFGILTSAVAIATPLAALGLRQAFAHDIGGKRLTEGEALGATLVLTPVLAALAALALWHLYGQSIPGLTPAVSAIVLSVACLGSLAINLSQGIALGKGDIRTFATTDALPSLLLTVATASLAALGFLSFGTVLLAYASSFALLLPYIFLRSRTTATIALPSAAATGKMMRYGIFFALNLFVIALNSRGGIIVLEQVSGAEQSGQLFAAMRLNDVLIEGAIAFGMVVFSRTVRANSAADSVSQSARIASWVFITFLLASIGIAFLAGPIIFLLLGSEYASATTALQLLCIGLGPAAASKIVYPAIAGTGQPLVGMPVLLVSVLVNVGLAFLLGPHYGAAGVALAFSLSQIIVYVGYAIAIGRRYKLPLREFFVPRRADAAALLRVATRLLPRPKS